jgi:signal peptidase I
MTSHVKREPRKPWLVLLLGVVCWSAAFSYVGRWRAGLVVVLLLLASEFALGWSGLIHHPWALWGWLVLACLTCIATTIGLALYARTEASRTPRWYQSWYGYLLSVLALSLPVTLVYTHQHWLGFRTFRIPSRSMSPSYVPGDFITADVRPAALQALRDGDAVVYRNVALRQVWIKRVVGMPGEHIQIQPDGIMRNGVRVDEPYAVYDNRSLPVDAVFNDVNLAEGQLFMLGDNRNNSVDSRLQGVVSRDAVVGIVRSTYFRYAPHVSNQASAAQ